MPALAIRGDIGSEELPAGAAGERRSYQRSADRDRQRSGRYGSGECRAVGRNGPPDLA
jgi:hypothetical protein